MHNINPLAKTMEIAQASTGLNLGDLTVLALQNDPFRRNTPAGHRDGEWLAVAIDELGPDRVLHLRGWHYVFVTASRIKPDGKPYQNTEDDWDWLQSKVAKAARWLGYVPFEKIVDERNAPPIIRSRSRHEPLSYLNVELDVDLPSPDELMPTVQLKNFIGEQPYRLAIIAEKSSPIAVLAPKADQYGADLWVPTGEISDTFCYELARLGAEDGRKTQIFYVADCDPSGHQMSDSVARKMQALRIGFFPDFEYELHRVALKPEQVCEHNLPSTPLKDTERRAENWIERMGVEQTELDALMALAPGLLEQIVENAITPFYDKSLERRVRQARATWITHAQAALDEELGDERLAVIREEAEQRLAVMAEQIEALQEELQISTDGIALPNIPEIPGPLIDHDEQPEPLIDSDWDFVTATQRLKADRAYER